MHKNAIKKVRGVKFLEILAKNSCFSRVLGLFCSCFSCFFGSAIVFFKKKNLVTLHTSVVKNLNLKSDQKVKMKLLCVYVELCWKNEDWNPNLGFCQPKCRTRIHSLIRLFSGQMLLNKVKELLEDYRISIFSIFSLD